MKQPPRMHRRSWLSSMLALCVSLGALFALVSTAGAAGSSPAGARAFTVPTQEGVALAQIATVRVLAFYSITYTLPANPKQSNLANGVCTGLGVLVQSVGTAGGASPTTLLLTSSQVLASDWACPETKPQVLPTDATVARSVFSEADIYLSRAYLGQAAPTPSPSFIVPAGDPDLHPVPTNPQPVLVGLTPATGTLAHDYPTVALSPTTGSNAITLDLRSASATRLTNDQLNNGPGTPTPTIKAKDFLFPASQPTSTTLTQAPGAPVINPATGAVEGVLNSDGTVLSLAAVQVPNTLNTCPGEPPNAACLTNRWKAAMDAFYGGNKHDLTKLRDVTSNTTYQDFGGAQDFLAAALALPPTNGSGGKTNPPSTNSGPLGLIDFTNPITIALVVLVVLLILVFLVTFLILQQQRRKRAQQQAAAAPEFRVRSKASGQLAPSYSASPPAGTTAAYEAMPQNNGPVWRTIICPRCGMQNNQGSSVCFNCGLDLPQGIAGTSGSGRGLLGRSTSGGPAPLPLPSLTPPPPPAQDVAEMPTHIFQLPGSGKADREVTLPTMPAVSGSKQEEPTMVVRGRQRPPLGMKVSTKTDPGRRRKDNEDNFLAVTGTWKHNGQLQPFGLFVIADGMGGHANGQDASRIAIESIYQHLAEAMPKQDTPDEALGSLLQDAIQRANQMIYQQNQKDHADMGCTMTAALVTGIEAHICNVGDSRTYLLNPNDHLTRVTTDHSIVESLVAAGVIQKDDVYTHPKRNQIYRSLGEKEAAEIDVFRQRLTPGDKLLLCCDGLWEMIRDPDIEQVMRQEDLPHVTNTLVELANENGGVDNITAIVVKVMEEARPAKQPMIQSVAAGPSNLDHSQR